MISEGHIFYNKDLCKKYGVDVTTFKTYNDFLKACQKFKDASVTPIALGNKPGWPGSQWFQYFLGETLQKDELWACLNRTKKNQSPKWTDPGFVKAAQYLKDLVDRGFFDPGVAMMEYDAGKMMFFSGRSPFFLTGSWYETLSPPPELNWGLFRCPHITGEPGEKWLARTVTFLGSLIASTKCPYPDAQMKFIEFISRPKISKLFWKDSKGVPAIQGAVNESEMDFAQKEYSWLYKNANVAIPYLEYFVNPEAGYGAIYNGAVGITSGQLTPEEWMKQVEEAAIKTYE
jgi:raffinose/stachyose/melibiose transport system substrate-binding protein